MCAGLHLTETRESKLSKASKKTFHSIYLCTYSSPTEGIEINLNTAEEICLHLHFSFLEDFACVLTAIQQFSSTHRPLAIVQIYI